MFHRMNDFTSWTWGLTTSFVLSISSPWWFFSIHQTMSSYCSSSERRNTWWTGCSIRSKAACWRRRSTRSGSNLRKRTMTKWWSFIALATFIRWRSETIKEGDSYSFDWNNLIRNISLPLMRFGELFSSRDQFNLIVFLSWRLQPVHCDICKSSRGGRNSNRGRRHHYRPRGHNHEADELVLGIRHCGLRELLEDRCRSV